MISLLEDFQVDMGKKIYHSNLKARHLLHPKKYISVDGFKATGKKKQRTTGGPTVQLPGTGTNVITTER